MKNRIISALLALLLMVGTFSFLLPTTTYASASLRLEDAKTTDTPAEGEEGEGEEEEEDVDTKDFTYEDYTARTLKRAYATVEEMLASKYEPFALMMTKNGYSLYANKYTGDVVIKDLATGQYLTTTPTTMANVASDDVKAEVLSQIALTYSENGSETTFYSYVEAAKRGQITVAKIKNGVRVEYKIGRQSADYLVPGWITQERFQSQIMDKLEANGADTFSIRSLESFYTLKDPKKDGITQAELDQMYKNFPITKTGVAIRVFNSPIPKNYTRVENMIGSYTDYSYEDLQEDHDMTGYVSNVKAPPLFKVALEYTLTETGLRVELPANSIRFDEDSYKLSNISMLPYFGAGKINEEGYIFYPDGSGALLKFEDLVDPSNPKKGNGNTLSGKVYGQDYAYHTVTGAHIAPISMPVYGIVGGETTRLSGTLTSTTMNGYLAIITEGDSLTTIRAGSSGKHNYATAYPTFYPRPSDTYDLGESMSAGASGSWTVESSRKYTGRYIVDFVMLSDPVRGEAAVADRKITGYYETTWVGMAVAYRDYLEKNGLLTRLSGTKSDIPLYIETFGTIPSIERILSIPVNVDSPLTTFEDVATIYQDLADKGITNVNFKLTGYANGGLYSTYPVKVKWMKEIGGKKGYRNLLKDAKANDYGVFPEFDFAYVNNTSGTDGINIKKIVGKTIDDRYSSKQIYDSALQKFFNYFSLCISPSSFNSLYSKFLKKWNKYSNIGISVSTLGSDLNSDFNEDNPRNREDALDAICALLSRIDETNNAVMTEGGNVYVIQYVDHLLNAALDSSRYNYASASIPFVGFVLHGYVNFAGSAINMAGDIDYQILKAIENGASPYFILSYRNTELLKQTSDYSKYYSINYDIWFDKMVEEYNVLNNALKSVQTARLKNHLFLTGVRLPDEFDEAEAATDLAKIREDVTASTIASTKAEILAAYRDMFALGRIDSGLTEADYQTVVRAINGLLEELRQTLTIYESEVNRINAGGRSAIVDQINAVNVEIFAMRAELSNLEIARANAATQEEKDELLRQYNELNEQITQKNADVAELNRSLKDFEPAYTENYTQYTAYKAEIERYEAMAAMLERNVAHIDDVIAEAIEAATVAYDEAYNEKYKVYEDIVYVAYENGVAFILNYNVYSVTVEYEGHIYEIDSYGFVNVQ